METSDKSILKLYRKKERMGQGNVGELCPFCGHNKKRFGRFFICACTGKNISLPSGKSIKRNQKY